MMDMGSGFVPSGGAVDLGTMRRLAMEGAIDTLLWGLGQDTNNQHIKDTPKRVVKAFEEFLDVGRREPRFTTFNAESRDMVLEQDIHFYSLCAHHMLPFFGTAAVAYIPGRRRWWKYWEKPQIAGLSKLVRAVNYFSHRLQVQEELTSQIADYLVEKLNTNDVAVILKCEHLCLSMRGANSPGHLTTTASLRGSFFRHSKVRAELYSLLGSR